MLVIMRNTLVFLQIDWEKEENKPVTPKMLGTKVIKNIAIEDVVKYIDWNPFFQVPFLSPTCMFFFLLAGTNVVGCGVASVLVFCHFVPAAVSKKVHVATSDVHVQAMEQRHSASG